MIHYRFPDRWIKYDLLRLFQELTGARAAVLALTEIPYQKTWVEALQKLQLKREVAGTSRIEGADFTEGELEAALRESPEQLLTRSQRQAHAAVNTYRWIAALPGDRPLGADLIREIHRRIVTGADDDHCEPGALRRTDHNVTFGIPKHRGVEGGEECRLAFDKFAEVLRGEFQDHDLLIQALAAHYHLAAMHPFMDGNGRTARAVEALMLQRAGLREHLFIAMSNYYYDEKASYLQSLSDVQAGDHDLTPFLKFALKGVEIQCKRLFGEIRNQVSRALYRNLMFDLFNRLMSSKKRVIPKRQLEILKSLLEVDHLRFEKLIQNLSASYGELKNPRKAIIRDLSYLLHLEAIHVFKSEDGDVLFRVNLDWPTQITETSFYEKTRRLPKARTHSFLQ